MECVFYCETARGRRCVLMSPEDWYSILRNGHRMPCREGGNGCRIKNRVIVLSGTAGRGIR